MTPGMYFGEAEVLKGGTVSCRVSVASQRAILLGFPKEALEMFMDTKTRRDWLENHVIVKFPHEQEIRRDAVIGWKLKQLNDHAILDGLQGSYINEGERDAYLEWQIRRRQNKLRPWFDAIKEKNASIKARMKSITPLNLDPPLPSPVKLKKIAKSEKKRSKSTIDANRDLKVPTEYAPSEVKEENQEEEDGEQVEQDQAEGDQNVQGEENGEGFE